MSLDQVLLLFSCFYIVSLFLSFSWASSTSVIFVGSFYVPPISSFTLFSPLSPLLVFVSSLPMTSGTLASRALKRPFLL